MKVAHSASKPTATKTPNHAPTVQQLALASCSAPATRPASRKGVGGGQGAWQIETATSEARASTFQRTSRCSADSDVINQSYASASVGATASVDCPPSELLRCPYGG